MGIKVAVVGATGAVGRRCYKRLKSVDFPSDEVVALASSKSIGKEVSYGDDRSLKVQGLDALRFFRYRHSLIFRGGSISSEFGPKVAPGGSCYR